MTQTPIPTMTPTSASAVERLRTDIIASYPHDSTAFTEGLVFEGGRLFESTGQYGSSSLREVDPASGEVLRRLDLPSRFFGEGLALVDNHLIQLSWREHTAFVYNRETFTQLGQLSYTGEGWGLCFDGQWLYMSDGSSTITVRDFETFQVSGFIQVTLDNQPVVNVNELECLDELIYANVWHTDNILQIDKKTGKVAAVIEASGLLTREQQQVAGPEGVLNGIAYDHVKGTFLITGKYWPRLFEVRFVPASP